MKIGFDVSDLCTNRADGTTRYTLELAKKFPAPSDDTSRQWIYFGSCSRESTNFKAQNPNTEWISSPWPKYWTQSRLPWDLYRYTPDVLFMPIQQIPFIRPGKMKTVAVVHDLAFHVYPEQFTYKDWMLQHILTAYAVREADKIIAVSQATADDIAKYYGRTENVSVIHHGVDHASFTSGLRQGFGRQAQVPAKPYILYVGQIQPRKNLIRLIQAFEILQQNEKDLQLVIAGSHGWLNSPIYRYMGLSPARENIVQLGRVGDDELARLYNNAAAYVLPSLYEGFGMPILEAMACRCPVVTSNISSMPEVAGGAAVLVDPLNVESIAAGIQEARNRRKELIPLGLARAQQFTWEKTAEKTLWTISTS